MIIDLLKESEALLEGHFLLSSGKHSNGYVQCAKLMQYPDRAEEAVNVLVDQLRDIEVDMVVGPAMGGVVVAYELARQLGVPSIFTEREDGQMVLRRGFEIEEGMKVIIAEDVVTTGKSAFEAIDAVKRLGGDVVAITCLVDRREGIDLEIPLYSATEVDIEVYELDACPLCKEGSKAIKPGSREFK